jgi:hypothetical protein
MNLLLDYFVVGGLCCCWTLLLDYCMDFVGLLAVELCC